MAMKITLPLALLSGSLLAASAMAGETPKTGIRLDVLGTYASGVFNNSAAEIPAYDAISQRLFVVNFAQARIDVLDIADPANPTFLFFLDTSKYGVPNSVAVHNGLVATAVEDHVKTNPGKVVFFNADGVELNALTVGALPDMVTFTPDGTKALVANEGEPNEDYTIDPEGSVSIIDVSRGVQELTDQDVIHAGFEKFNSQKEQLISRGVRIFGPGASVAQDLEPEYIVVSADSTTAYVALQENNAIAVLEIATATFTDILPLGYKDHSLPGNGLDASDQDGEINIANWPVFGMYQPDGMAIYSVNGQEYLVTANEGDARDWAGFSEAKRVNSLPLCTIAFPNAAELQQNANLGRLTVTNTMGKNEKGAFEKLYVFGARSFSIWTTDGQLVFDSGDQMEQIIAQRYPAHFNSNHAASDFDTRSDNKGPEPEDVKIGEINGRYYAFIGLERIGGVMVWDVTDPTAPVFEQYVNHRDFSGSGPAGTAGDLGAEGLAFIPAQDSPIGQPLLVVANEVSGTTTIFLVSETPTGPE